MSSHADWAKRLRKRYGDDGQKISWILIDDVTEESCQIKAELNGFMRLFF